MVDLRNHNKRVNCDGAVHLKSRDKQHSRGRECAVSYHHKTSGEDVFAARFGVPQNSPRNLTGPNKASNQAVKMNGQQRVPHTHSAHAPNAPNAPNMSHAPPRRTKRKRVRQTMTLLGGFGRLFACMLALFLTFQPVYVAYGVELDEGQVLPAPEESAPEPEEEVVEESEETASSDDEEPVEEESQPDDSAGEEQPAETAEEAQTAEESADEEKQAEAAPGEGEEEESTDDTTDAEARPNDSAGQEAAEESSDEEETTTATSSQTASVIDAIDDESASTTDDTAAESETASSTPDTSASTTEPAPEETQSGGNGGSGGSGGGGGGGSSSSDDDDETVNDTETATTTDETTASSTKEIETATSTPETEVATTTPDTTDSGSSGSSGGGGNDETASSTPSGAATSTDAVATSTASTTRPIAEGDSGTITIGDTECLAIAEGEFYCFRPSAQENAGASDLGAAEAVVMQDADGDREIYLQNGERSIQITYNEYDDFAPVYDDSTQTIVWHALINDRLQVMMHERKSGKTTQITNESFNSSNPHVFNGKVVWQSWIQDNWEVFLAERLDRAQPKITQLTDNTTHDMFPKIFDQYISWQSQTNDTWHVVVYDIEDDHYSYVEKKGDGKYENPRFVLLFDNRSEDGEVEVVGYDVATDEEIPIAPIGQSTPAPITPTEDTGEAIPPTASSTVLVKTDRKEGGDDSQ